MTAKSSSPWLGGIKAKQKVPYFDWHHETLCKRASMENGTLFLESSLALRAELLKRAFVTAMCFAKPMTTISLSHSMRRTETGSKKGHVHYQRTFNPPFLANPLPDLCNR